MTDEFALDVLADFLRGMMAVEEAAQRRHR